MAEPKPEIKLFQQSLKEALDAELAIKNLNVDRAGISIDGLTDSDITFLGIVTGATSESSLSYAAILEATSMLIKNAERLTATHVYGVKYQGSVPSEYNRGNTLVTGDAYKITSTNGRGK